VQVVDFFARIVLITLGVVFMLSVMTGMAVIGYAVCATFNLQFQWYRLCACQE
jgi:hypothetical protein